MKDHEFVTESDNTINSDDELAFEKKEKENKFTIRFLMVLIATFVFFLGLQQLFQLRLVNVSGVSMEPTLMNEQKLFAYKTPSIFIKNKNDEYHRGQIIVFDSHGVDPRSKGHNTYIKRIIGLPGDTIKFDGKNIYVNNKKINQDFINKDQQQQGTFGPRVEPQWTLEELAGNGLWNLNSVKKLSNNTVPNGMYFVLGDNRGESNDSRYFGFVPEKNILGIAKTLTFNKDDAHKINDDKLN